MSIVVSVAAYGALTAAGTDSEIAKIVGILFVIDGETDAHFPSSVTPLFHHLRECFTPTTLPVVFFEFEFLNLDNPLYYMLLTLPSTALPIV